MRVAIQYKYFKDNNNRSQSQFAKLITKLDTNQTDNRNEKEEAYQNSTSNQRNKVSGIETLELTDFAKYTNRILLKKSEIKPLNQIGAYIEMEFEDPKGLLNVLKNRFENAKTSGKDDLTSWIELSSKIFFDSQADIIKNPSESPTKINNIKLIHQMTPMVILIQFQKTSEQLAILPIITLILMLEGMNMILKIHLDSS
ncbi:hypothetical protein [Mycoplasma sp. 'Moose RK']|uniref:hypothetical protein n=1 Tax=Mycoplasma sp. 'Moose RK' TaxID=2780095 RepID=UPI0018C1DF68|nr:hypothetical protein [Mycoplasma sp. 'Moose RK']MBG0731053.1 hypothetical protein [Mycoplasma sp. 'Moose RK']